MTFPTPATADFRPAPSDSPLPPKPAAPRIADLGFYYENGRRYLKASGAGFIVLNEAQVRRHLMALGFSRSTLMVGAASPVETALREIEETMVVDHAGPLAGRRAGRYVINGKRVLVTDSPRLPLPDPAVAWPLLRRVIEEALGHDPLQLTHLYGWLKVAYTTLRDGLDAPEGPSGPGQALALTGPRNCGKSLLQDLIRECLGGRSADPFVTMAGLSHFNSDLLGAEVLMFGDQHSDTRMAARRQFGAMLKQYTVNTTQRCEAKGRDALILNPFWRLVISVNDETENLHILPPLDDSLRDKLMLLKARSPAVFQEPVWHRPKRELWRDLTAELPGLLHHVVSFTIPPALVCSRFGIVAYQHPELLAALGAFSDEARLLELIDAEIFHRPGDHSHSYTTWSGKAADLERRLLNGQPAITHQVRQLLYYSAAAGTYLARLCESQPHRVTAHRSKGYTSYRITPPERPEEDESAA